MSRLSLVVLVAITGCSAHHTVHTKPAMRAKAAPKKPPAPKQVALASPNIAVSNELADGCVVQIVDLGKAPKFEYDDSDLLAADREVLDRIAACVTSGPLTGRTLQLIGRADPRGTQEYNLGLGTKRAHSVQTYLERIGVAAQQISTTTRGDLDANGRDEPTWRGDRRVDLELLEASN